MWGALLLLSIPAAAALDALRLPQLYVVAFLSGALAMCFETARHAYLPSLVSFDDLAEGNRRVAVAAGLTRVTGPGIAGGIIQLLTAPVAIVVQTALFALSGFSIWRIRATEPTPSRSSDQRVWASLGDGLRYAWNERVIRAFALAEGTFQFYFAAMQAVLLVFFVRWLHLSAGMIGLIFTAGSAGGLIGAFVARHVERRLPLGQTMLVGSALRVLGLLAIPMAVLAGPSAFLFLIGARGVSSLGWTIWQIYQETTQQLLLPNRLRGRVTPAARSFSFVAGERWAASPARDWRPVWE